MSEYVYKDVETGKWIFDFYIVELMRPIHAFRQRKSYTGKSYPDNECPGSDWGMYNGDFGLYAWGDS